MAPRSADMAGGIGSVPPPGLEQVVTANLDAAYNLARWLLRDPSAAEDVVQDAVLRALRYGGWRGGDGRAWLLQIVRNASYDWLSRRRARAEVALETTADGVSGPADRLADPAPDPEAALAARETRDGLAAAVAALPPELRECLVLREMEEMSYRDIARITGAPVGTVMSRLWRARRALVAATTKETVR
jgi:RNA polymerase sigma factor (sigma-70 family)